MWLWRAYKCHTFLINTVVFLTGCTCKEPYDTRYSLTVQQHVTVQEGLCVTVPCTFTIDPSKKLSSNSMGYWSKCPDNKTEQCFNNPAPSKMPSIHVSNASNRDCSFTLTDADKRDAGKYEFRLEDGTGQQLKWTYRIYPTYITVTDLTDKPEIVLPEMLVAGRDVSLICRSPGRSCGTPPLFTWEINRDQAKSNSFITLEGKNMSISECNEPNITLRLSKDDHNTSITCKVTLSAVGRSTEKTITLNVQYPPSISISEGAGGNTANKCIDVQEGASVNLTFLVDSNPPSTVILMREAERSAVIFTGERLILHLKNITVTAAGTYTVSASNQHRDSSGSVCINVQREHLGSTRRPNDHSSEPRPEAKKSTINIQIRDIMIGFLGGITLALFAILIVKFITRIRQKDKPDTVPLSADSDRNELYMNVSPAAQDTPNPPKRNRNKEQEHPMEEPDEQALNYASINFTPVAPTSPRVNSSEPVYARVRNMETS
uniref:Ig-like domain-containing protein n=1 Tax=Leptobrachium leishanense TaxID=445787 RepID=A0A8C5QHC9_9ANUR